MDRSKKGGFPKLLISILTISSDIPLFETCCDNIGFVCSRGRYLLEIQADMEIQEMGYNMKLLKPFRTVMNVIGVSGRCCHGLTTRECIGKVGYLMDRSLLDEVDVNAFYTGETCIRGPLLLDANKLQQMGYLDEQNYFLDDSDHDLFVRAFVQNGWICGYIPIEVISIVENGSTRKPRNELNEFYYNKYKMEKTGNGFLKTYLDSKPPSRYIRKLMFS
jgi:hypothetical protein